MIEEPWFQEVKCFNCGEDLGDVICHKKDVNNWACTDCSDSFEDSD